jgi:molecular chaperone GrpE
VSEPKPPRSEGWESLVEDAEDGVLSPSPELEDALREAEASIDARAAERRAREAAGAEGPAGPAEVAALRARVAELEAELAGQTDRMARLAADFENHRRRTLRERQEALQYAHQNLVKDLLPVVDNLDRAIEHAERSGGADFDGMLQGVELVRRELHAVLVKHGVSEIEARGLAFDPNLHEAMAQMEDRETPPGHVAMVLQRGYRLHDRLLRPARVMVAKAPSDEAGGSE